KYFGGGVCKSAAQLNGKVVVITGANTVIVNQQMCHLKDVMMKQQRSFGMLVVNSLVSSGIDLRRPATPKSGILYIRLWKSVAFMECS
ncbi:hypothetical protein E2320_021210, partial [Naja naja]